MTLKRSKIKRYKNYLSKKVSNSRAAIVVFVGRMFNNLAIIRRYYLSKWTSKKQENEQVESTEKTEETSK